MIRKFNFKTPGREDDDVETKLYTKADVKARKDNEFQAASVLRDILQKRMQITIDEHENRIRGTSHSFSNRG